MSNKIEYYKGQELGPYHIKYIREIEPDIDKKNPSRTIRKAEFQCGYCGKLFPARINNVKNGHTSSCGCYGLKRSIETIKQYNSLELPP